MQENCTAYTLKEFRDYCQEKSPKRIIFSTENNKFTSPVNCSLNFDIALVSNAPSMKYVYFGSSGDYMLLQNIQGIHIRHCTDHGRVLWDVVKIRCGLLDRETTYAFLFDY